jgi:hypothetical protein
MSDVSYRASAMLLLVACALVGHLFMLADAGGAPAEQHSAMSAATSGAGIPHTDPTGPFPHKEAPATVHAMAITCTAVLAASGVILGLNRALATPDGEVVANTGRSLSTWHHLRNLWPPPRADEFGVDSGALLLI